MKKHIAGSGARVGQWVNCGAKKCRLGGTHISERDFYATRAWLQEEGTPKTASKVTEKDVENFKAATVNDGDKWARKAEYVARKAKGLKDGNFIVFEGEKNLVDIPKKNAKFIPASQAFKPAPKAAPAGPKPERYIDIPGVKAFLQTGDFKALAQARKEYKIPQKTIESIASIRVRLAGLKPTETLFTSQKTGKQHAVADVPGVREYLRTGNEEVLKEAAADYTLFSDQLDRVRNTRSRLLRAEKLEAKKQKKEKTTAVAPAPKENPPPQGSFRELGNRLKEASARLTNVTDDLSKLTSQNEQPAPPASRIKGFLSKVLK
jgi:hypothetical protein